MENIGLLGEPILLFPLTEGEEVKGYLAPDEFYQRLFQQSVFICVIFLMNKAETRAFAASANRYGTFLCMPVNITHQVE